ncbi:MAG: hypothetical protein HZB53_03180 [Chloroflexi bacterium]|nr:hypothetical protein [Chloroflexota bacterium]
MDYVIGLDAGGTKTSVVVLDGERRELGRGTGGPGNYHTAGRDGAQEAIGKAVTDALAQAGLGTADMAAACFAMSGVSRPADRAVADGFACAVLPGARVLICNDAVAALYSGVGKPEGVVVIAGTGSIVYGLSQGRTARAGGWGYRLGDEGSGYWLAEQSLRAIVRAHDGCAPATSMTEPYLRQLGLARPGELISWAYRPDWTRDAVSALAPLTFEAAQAGDAPALAIVQAGVDMLAAAVQVTAEKLALHSAPFDVVLFGSLFRSVLYEYAMRRALGERTAHARPVVPAVDAAVGAAWMALDHLKGETFAWLE